MLNQITKDLGPQSRFDTVMKFGAATELGEVTCYLLQAGGRLTPQMEVYCAIKVDGCESASDMYGLEWIFRAGDVPLPCNCSLMSVQRPPWGLQPRFSLGWQVASCFRRLAPLETWECATVKDIATHTIGMQLTEVLKDYGNYAAFKFPAKAKTVFDFDARMASGVFGPEALKRKLP